MLSDLINFSNMDGYGHYIWSAFGLQEDILVPFPAARITAVQAIVNYFDEMAA